ncbi:MAG: hypothetical protein AVDCRST_MAG90-641 [uncultured Microvirga sp.]|uniref:Uncharacterized protein n=1 Tax=uncultured Microvirga sp. TaxID=412392 RepID=A0A6J4KTK0_9HYPH|nr:MAG: hypothetical protein AVDCRST_MAG90-641 [uncultured Microvirga sp.]
MPKPFLLALLVAGLAAPALAQPSPAASTRDMRELVEAARAGAKAAQENVEYARVVPDILTQILIKLDKLENKLDKIETSLQREPTPGAAQPAGAPRAP